MAYRSTALAALSDPTRRAIFERVARRPSAVGDLARGLPVFDGGATTVTIEHRTLECFGESADMVAGKLRGGWLGMLGRYVQYVAKSY